ncbi:putative ethanolamine kinase A, partial [Smittium culicis]
MGQEPLSELVPIELAKWHKAQIPSPKEPSLFITLRKWLAQLPESYQDQKKNEIYKNSFDISDISKQIDLLEQIIKKINPPVAFCHNDLLSGNVLLDDSKEQYKVTFIDYEYGSYNYRGYDIANHFCEYA